MRRRTLISAAAVVVLMLAGVNLWFRPNLELQQSETSFGVGQNGYKAAHDLLLELGFPVIRSYVRPSRLSMKRPLWFVSPSFLEPGKHGADDDAHEFLRWVSAGGTAVVFGGPGADWKRLGLARETSASSGKLVVVEGDFTPVARQVAFSGLLYFKAAGDKARVRLRADGAAFALERAVGAGRLITIADDRFLRNADLGDGDNSLIVVDLVRALGAPGFDEHSHGLAAPVSIIAALAGSRAILPILVAFLAALLWIGEQHSWPRRNLADEPEGPEPSIATFVESLGVLYSRAGDPAAVFRAYRGGFLRRLRRQMSPRADLPTELLVERLAHDRSLSAETRRWLVEGDEPKNHSELVIAVRAIESYPRIGL
ncbi:MAG: DUF4350 domain-containing protein [Candidatus Binataceae bacterium]